MSVFDCIKSENQSTKIVFRTYHWPILTALWIVTTFGISYIISVYDGHVYPFFPFISETGTKSPESCIFGQLLNLGALCMAITVYIRYKFVQLVVYKINNKIELWNNLATVMGYLACLGMSIVANFQELNLNKTHTLGAVMAFGLGAVYFILQACITWMSDSKGFLTYLRILLCVVILPLLACNTFFTNLAIAQFDGDDQLLWDPDDAGYDMRLAASICEWGQAFIMCIYISTFTPDFKQIEFRDIIFEKTDYQ